MSGRAVQGPREAQPPGITVRREVFGSMIATTNRAARAVYQSVNPCAGESYSPPGLVAVDAEACFNERLALVRPGTDLTIPGTAAMVWARLSGGRQATLIYDLPDGTMSDPQRMNLSLTGRWEIRINTAPAWVTVLTAAASNPADCAALAARLLTMTDPDANLIEAALLS